MLPRGLLLLDTRRLLNHELGGLADLVFHGVDFSLLARDVLALGLDPRVGNLEWFLHGGNQVLRLVLMGHFLVQSGGDLNLPTVLGKHMFFLVVTREFSNAQQTSPDLK